MNMKYKTVVLDFETTGLDFETDEILQVSIIDGNNNILMNEYCKPKFKKSWEEAQEINNISPEMVEGKKHFEYYAEKVEEILNNAEVIVIYNADFELNFLKKYNVKVNSCIYDLMVEFAELYGEWNNYYQTFTWQKLSTCCLYYGYYIDNAHDSLEDCKATLYCYHKVLNGEGSYEGAEFIGKTVKEFLDEVWTKINNTSISILSIYPNEKIGRKPYIRCEVNSYNDIKYPQLLSKKIFEVKYISPKHFSLKVENFIEGDYELLKNEKQEVDKKNIELENEVCQLIDKKNDNYRLYAEQLKKNGKLSKQLFKMKEKLGLVLKKETKVPMYNSYGFYTADYCRTTKKPMIQPDEYSAFSDILLSESKCKKIKQPVLEKEKIYAFLRVRNGYCALYFRNLKK